MRHIVLATGNPGKLAELQALLQELDIAVHAQNEYELEGAAETGLTFVENALLKARYAARHTGLSAIADDSGLEVDALAGGPGIHSARFADRHGDDAANNRKLLDELDGADDRGARFRCVVVSLKRADEPAPLICQGVWEGEILHAPRGEAGFGYDPLFLGSGETLSAAELPPGRKNRISHRARAMVELARSLSDGE
jgi:XTP/dITP diphosphohydrolase